LINANSVAKLLDLTPSAANALIKDLESLGILKEMTGFKRNRLFMFEKYMHLF
jgi:Fic family protein